MMEKMIALQQKRRSKKGGFTLVELIVVLVILAILAALLIPALPGYIDKAKQKQIIAETRQVVMAAQTLVDEAYGTKNVGDAITVGTADSATVKIADVAKLAEVKGEINSVTVGKIGNVPNKITKVEYTNNGKKCTFTASNKDQGSYNVEK